MIEQVIFAAARALRRLSKTATTATAT